MQSLNYPQVDTALTPYIFFIMALLHPPLYLLVSRVLHGVVGASTRRCTFARKIGQHRTIACYPRFVPAVAHVRYDKLLPRHQGPRHRMYFHAGDVPQIRSQPTKVIRRDILRLICEKMVCHPRTSHFLFRHRYFIKRILNKSTYSTTYYVQLLRCSYLYSLCM